MSFFKPDRIHRAQFQSELHREKQARKRLKRLQHQYDLEQAAKLVQARKTPAGTNG